MSSYWEYHIQTIEDENCDEGVKSSKPRKVMTDLFLSKATRNNISYIVIQPSLSFTDYVFEIYRFHKQLDKNVRKFGKVCQTYHHHPLHQAPLNIPTRRIKRFPKMKQKLLIPKMKRKRRHLMQIQVLILDTFTMLMMMHKFVR